MLAKLIATRVKEKGWSQTELAREAGLSKGLISLILGGHLLNITADTAGKLGEALDIPAEQVVAAALLDLKQARTMTARS